MGRYANEKHVLINFDIKREFVVNLLETPRFKADCCFIMLLNCDTGGHHPYENYIIYHSMSNPFITESVELNDDIWEKLRSMIYRGELIFLDGELLATDLPTTEVPNFDEIYGDSDAFYSDIRKWLRPCNR